MMKAIAIKVVEQRATLKHKVEHTPDGEIIVHKLPSEQWQNNNMARGQIIFDGHESKFFMSLEYWSLDDYIGQWNEGLTRLRDHNRSCLVENFHKIRGTITWSWWLLYKIHGNVYIQFRHFPPAQYAYMTTPHLFTPDTCYGYIPRRITHDGGERIVQTIIPFTDFF